MPRLRVWSPVRAHTRSDQWLQEWVEQQINVSVLKKKNQWSKKDLQAFERSGRKVLFFYKQESNGYGTGMHRWHDQTTWSSPVSFEVSREGAIILYPSAGWGWGWMKLKGLGKRGSRDKVWSTKVSRHFVQIGQEGQRAQLVISETKKIIRRVCVQPGHRQTRELSVSLT